MKSTYKIRTYEGKQEVEGQIIGRFGVRMSVPGSYVVDHLATGATVHDGLSFADARSLAKHLDAALGEEDQCTLAAARKVLRGPRAQWLAAQRKEQPK